MCVCVCLKLRTMQRLETAGMPSETTGHEKLSSLVHLCYYMNVRVCRCVCSVLNISVLTLGSGV